MRELRAKRISPRFCSWPIAAPRRLPISARHSASMRRRRTRLLRPRCGRAWFPSVLDPDLPAARMGAAMISGEAIAPARDVEEGRLIAASLAGDDDAFRQLVERHHRMVLNVAFRAFGSMAAAEDCAQDVFIKVHTPLRSYRADTPFIHWLHRVAANTVTDALRRRRADLSLDSLVHEACSESGDPADAAARQEQRTAGGPGIRPPR